ncbi:MAG: endonuclease III [Sandaracinaceae bacterium]|nr:endonuclease III [Sandaracinaceae bacterium]
MSKERKARAKKVLERLAAAMPEPECELDFKSPWQLLVATILSAQSTDKMINKITPALFAKWPEPKDLAKASQEDVEVAVKSSGFFHNKAKSLRATATIVTTEYGGEVPKTVDELTRLPGVARKTANVVLGTAYRISNGVTIDTHAGRVSRRLELTEHDDPVKVEKDLMALFPQKSWIDLGHRFVLHGRYVCLARKPKCTLCPLNEICPSAEAKASGKWPERAEREGALVRARGVTEDKSNLEAGLA